MIFQPTSMLKNHTSTYALLGTTLYEAATGSKLDLSAVHEWGTIIWVHNLTGLKLNPWAHEGHWVGLDSNSKGTQYYQTECYPQYIA